VIPVEAEPHPPLEEFTDSPSKSNGAADGDGASD
jgi:hypothetical protein